MSEHEINGFRVPEHEAVLWYQCGSAQANLTLAWATRKLNEYKERVEQLQSEVADLKGQLGAVGDPTGAAAFAVLNEEFNAMKARRDERVEELTDQLHLQHKRVEEIEQDRDRWQRMYEALKHRTDNWGYGHEDGTHSPAYWEHQRAMQGRGHKEPED